LKLHFEIKTTGFEMCAGLVHVIVLARLSHLSLFWVCAPGRLIEAFLWTWRPAERLES